MSADPNILLDKSTPFDVNKAKLLDQLVNFFYANPTNPNSALANTILTSLKEDPDFWVNADLILENAQDPNTKFFALQVLETAVKTRWKILPDDQKTAIKNYIVTMVVKMGSAMQDKGVSHLLNKINMILVEILKVEWNTTWKNFIPDICQSSKQDQNICENNLNLLKILSEEIFDYSKNQMTSQQTKELKATMEKEFEAIYELCYFIVKSFLDNPQQVRTSLIEACLKTLHAFLSWIPLGYIFLTDLIDLILQLFEFKELKVLSLRCLIEIVQLPIENCSSDEGKKIQEQIFKLYSSFVSKLSSTLPYEMNIAAERFKLEKSKNPSLGMFDNFCQLLVLFLTNFLKTHLTWIEPLANDPQNPDQMAILELIKKAFGYLVQLSQLPDQIFKICVDYWYEFTTHCLKNQKNNNFLQAMNMHEPLLLLGSTYSGANYNLHTYVYTHALSQVRSIMISRMAKPLEVLLVIDETGRPIRQTLQNTENNSLYEIMKELLCNLTRLDWENTKTIMLTKLEKQLDGSEWSFDNLNSLSWAIGSISGTVSPSDEKNFLINLLTLCEQKKGKENKAVVASDIMYVVGQYPRFLQSNWNFLRTVVKKLFEFMKETYPGVMVMEIEKIQINQEMAVNTFLKISEKCKEQFVIIHQKDSDHQHGESEPFVDELIRKIADETHLLEAEHKLVFFEAVGHMISCEKDFERKQHLIGGVLAPYWDYWDGILKEIEMNLEVIKDEKCIEQCAFIVRVHERLAFSIGNDFFKALARVYMDLIKLYCIYSQFITNEIQVQGKYAINHFIVKKIRGVKKEILRLFTTFIERATDLQMVTQNFIPPLVDILQDFSDSVPDGREAEVLSLFTTIVEKLTSSISDTIPKILDLIFGATLQMVTDDFNSYHDHRVNLFKFILSITNHCFGALFNIPPEQFKTLIDCVIWAMKHELPSIFEVGLEALHTILKNVNLQQDIANQFYQVYYMDILNDILYVLTNGFHKQGFKQQAQILCILIGVVCDNFVTIPLDSAQGNLSSKEYIYNYMVNALSTNFPTLSKHQTGQYLEQLFLNYANFNQFKVILRDYLINMTQFDPEAVEELQSKGEMQTFQ